MSSTCVMAIKNTNMCVKAILKRSSNYIVNFGANKYNAGRTQ